MNLTDEDIQDMSQKVTASVSLTLWEWSAIKEAVVYRFDELVEESQEELTAIMAKMDRQIKQAFSEHVSKRFDS